MTFSEFGRQIASNFSLGTDHGTAAPLFVFGSCVKPGFTGLNPVIPVLVEDQEGVEMQIDFRDVYGTLLTDWFDIPEDDVKRLLYQDFQKLNLEIHIMKHSQLKFLLSYKLLENINQD